MRFRMKTLVVLLTVVGIFMATDSFSVCDDAHEVACTALCSCTCSSQQASLFQNAPHVEISPIVLQAFLDDPVRSDMLLKNDIFRPPIGV